MDQFSTLSVFLATFGGLSYWLAALVLGVFFYILVKKFSKSSYEKLIIFTVAVVLAVVVSEQAAMVIGSTDPSQIVLDEFVAVPFIYLGYKTAKSRNKYAFISIGALLFGLLDWMKPFGIDGLGNLPGGIGIVADDIGAALLAAIILYLLQRVTNNRI